ncbi:WbqC family protein [Sunxiuqinia sp. sy24]|uniref:WbqC family protein n=1 Tax=Sunxiuqinia sp. sy24 TaxID=3461495 RepID=UPI0040460650
MIKPDILLSTAYFPPVQYLSKFVDHPSIWIETAENFTKQTYRNRTIILAANGPESLIFPVEKGRSRKQLIKDIRISYDTNWQHIHWQAIVSAYQSSPFFEVLQDDFRPFFEKHYSFLLDFNQEILQTVLDILELSTTIKLTEDFEEVSPNCLNFREAIHPKPQKALPDSQFEAQPYAQVFDNKFGFTPNLSCLDLLFNSGSESYEILLKSIQHD